MQRRQFFRILTGSAAVAIGFGASGCVYYPEGPVAAYDGPDRRYDYYYYPGANVYFHFLSGLYYYHHLGRWHSARRLPRHIRVNRRHRRRLSIRGERPYRRNRQHRRRYSARSDGRRQRRRHRRRF